MIDDQLPEPEQHWRDMLKAIRQRRGWSQKRLAYELSVSRRTVQNWELGVTQPNARDVRVFTMLMHGSAA